MAYQNRRLAKEFADLLKRTDLENFVACPEESNTYEWHFCIFGLTNSPYEGGFYHGRLSFPRDYPFKPPGIKMLTPSGRFEPGKKICTTFSDYHPELWNPSWTVTTILLGLVSFMDGDEFTAGAIITTEAKKRKHAAESLEYNFKNIEKFQQVFEPYFDKLGIDPVTKTATTPIKKQQSSNQEETKEAPVKKSVGLPSMTISELMQRISFVKEPYTVLDFTSLGGEQAMDTSFLQVNKHRIHHITTPFQKNSELANKFNVTQPLSLITLKTQDQSNGDDDVLEPVGSSFEDLKVLIESLEQDDQAKVDQRKAKLDDKMAKRREAAQQKADALRKKQQESLAREKERIYKEKVGLDEIMQDDNDNEGAEVKKKDDLRAKQAQMRADAAKMRQEALKNKMTGQQEQPGAQDNDTNASTQKQTQASDERQKAAKQRMEAMKAKMDQRKKEQQIQSQVDDFLDKDFSATQQANKAQPSAEQLQRAQALKSAALSSQQQVALKQMKLLQDNILLDSSAQQQPMFMNQFVLQALFNQIDETGDMVLVASDHMDVDEMSFVEPSSQNLKIGIPCHSQVLQAYSPFFAGLLTFNDANQDEEQMHIKPDNSKVSLDYPESVLVAFREFLYTGKTQISSDILIDLLSLAHEVLATQLKQTIEQILSQNISFDNFSDTYLVAQGFDCLMLKDALVAFGQSNLQEMRVRRLLGGLQRQDQVRILNKTESI